MKKTFQLPKEFLADWLEALRSQQYGQGQSELYNPLKDEYCCLGIGCLVAGHKKEELYEIPEYSSSLKNYIPIELPNSVENVKVPELLLDSAFEQKGTICAKSGFSDIVACMNDGKMNLKTWENEKDSYPNLVHPELDEGKEISFGFEEIADFIELNVKGV